MTSLLYLVIHAFYPSYSNITYLTRGLVLSNSHISEASSIHAIFDLCLSILSSLSQPRIYL